VLKVKNGGVILPMPYIFIDMVQQPRTDQAKIGFLMEIFYGKQRLTEAQHITQKANILNHSLLLSFWTLSIVRISTNQKTRFRNWICFRLKAREGGGGTYSTEEPKTCLSTGDARTKGQPLETRGL
jgi:hypothetical protein